MSISIRISHETPGADKAIKVFAQGPQGAPVISFVQPGESAAFDVSDCNELHLCEWNADPKAAAAPAAEGE